MHKNIKKVVGKPTRDEIKRVYDFMRKNAAGEPYELGKGHNEHLGITMRERDYASETTEEFEKHPNPGLLPLLPENTV